MSEERRHSRKDSRALRTIAGIPVDDPDNDDSVGLDAEANGNTYDNSPQSAATNSNGHDDGEIGVGLVVANNNSPPQSTPPIEKQEQQRLEQLIR